MKEAVAVRLRVELMPQIILMLVELLHVDGRWPKDALSNLAAVFCSRPGETATSPRFSALLGCKPCELVDCSPMHGTF